MKSLIPTCSAISLISKTFPTPRRALIAVPIKDGILRFADEKFHKEFSRLETRHGNRREPIPESLSNVLNAVR
jgi:hypothetical protein